MSSLIAVFAAIASALLLGISSVADQRSTKRVESRRALSPRILLDLAGQPLWLTALGANLIGFALQVVALNFGSLALVQPILVCDLVFAVLILWFLRRRPGSGRARQTGIVFAGVAATVIGVAGFLAIGRPSSGTTHVSFGVLPPLADQGAGRDLFRQRRATRNAAVDTGTRPAVSDRPNLMET